MKGRFLLAVLLPFFALGLQWMFWQWIAPSVWFLFFPAVFCSARLGGLKGGLASTLLSAAIVWYFFIPPQMSWSFDKPANLYLLMIFLLMGYIFSDVHERLLRAQNDTESALTETVEQAAVGIAMVSPEGHWIRVNRRLCDIVGYHRSELLAKTFHEITHPDDLDADLQLARRMLAGEIKTYALEKRYIHKNGRAIWINLTVSLVRKADGSPDYFISVVEDIEARKQAETALRISEERLNLFIAHAPAAIAMFDREMRYLAASNRWLSDYGISGANIVGRSHYEIFPEISDQWKAFHRRGLAGEVVKAEEDRFERLDGTVRWLRWEIWPWHMRDASVGGILIFTEDITGFKQAMQEIHQLNADLERRVEQRTAELTAANRELDAFAYAVSHDLRAPLRAMSGFANALIEDYGDRFDGEAKLYLDQIDIASRKMSDLIDGLLTLSRSTRGEVRRDAVDLSELSECILRELQQTDSGRHVVGSVEPGLVADGDARMLEAVMRNLLGNAWKYSARAEPAHIRVYTEQRDNRRWYCVSDNGAGFDMAHAARLFQPFQRLHRQDEFAGIGIGLATVQRIVHRHGGSIEARAESGKGATFSFTLSGDG